LYNRELHQYSRQTRMPNVLWTGKPALLPYLLVNANMAAYLVVFVFGVLIMRVPLVRLVCGLLGAAMLLSGLWHWVWANYTITMDGCFVTDWRSCYGLAWHELLPSDYTVVQSPVEKFFGCETIVYGVAPMRAALRGPWRHKAIFWCIKDSQTPRNLIESVLYGNR